MILVDSSVWIEFLRGKDRAIFDAVSGLIKDSNRVCICGIIMQEVFQGIRDDREHSLVKEKLELLPFLEAGKHTYIAAADIYRTLRKKGKTVPGADALIAALAIEHEAGLYTLDLPHFQMIAENLASLRLYDGTGR